MSAELDILHPSVAYAAQFIRHKYSVWEPGHTVTPDFEQEFNCCVIYEHSLPRKVIFNTEQELLLFVLRFTDGSDQV